MKGKKKKKFEAAPRASLTYSPQINRTLDPISERTLWNINAVSLIDHFLQRTIQTNMDEIMCSISANVLIKCLRFLRAV